jgi:hypothetical protein
LCHETLEQTANAESASCGILAVGAVDAGESCCLARIEASTLGENIRFSAIGFVGVWRVCLKVDALHPDSGVTCTVARNVPVVIGCSWDRSCKQAR